MSASKMTRNDPQLWSGRYSRIPGETTAFHISNNGNHFHAVVKWDAGIDRLTCPVVASEATLELAAAVADGKRFLDGSEHGGSFLINEFGQVLVPSANRNGVAIVGEYSGPLEIQDIGSDRVVDLASTTEMELGASFDRPYVGIQYKVSKQSEIYFWRDDENRREKELPSITDDELLGSVRTLRPSGGVTLLVGYGGLVAIKVPKWNGAGTEWDPIYVGKIDRDKWFKKEKA